VVVAAVALGAPVCRRRLPRLTGAVLIWDLEHPERFYYIFTRPQWRSWLVRGASSSSAYGAVLALHFARRLSGDVARGWLAVAGLPLALMTAVYTAYLFAQAKARDLWQNPLLPPHLLVQALLAGAAVLAAVAHGLDAVAVDALGWIVAGSAARRTC
jgi:formate-dependent nitrite reductase membrane component NrfD